MPNYTRSELLIFALKSSNFHELFDQWVESGFDRWYAPSFDRKDDYKGYSFENFNKWMKWRENSNKHHSDRKNGINNKRSKAIIGIHKDTGMIVEFYSGCEAERKTKIDGGHISKCCHGKRKSAGGYYWNFKDIET